MTLPHTYEDSDGAKLVVSRSTGRIEITEVDDVDSDVVQAHAIVSAPTGEDAAELARALLEAAGDTGCVVISTEELSRRDVAAAKTGADIGSVSAARSMRERAAQSAEEDDIARASRIRALPLFPDEEPTEVRHITDAVGRVIRTDRVPLTADTDA